MSLEKIMAEVLAPYNQKWTILTQTDSLLDFIEKLGKAKKYYSDVELASLIYFSKYRFEDTHLPRLLAFGVFQKALDEWKKGRWARSDDMRQWAHQYASLEDAIALTVQKSGGQLESAVQSAMLGKYELDFTFYRCTRWLHNSVGQHFLMLEERNIKTLVWDKVVGNKTEDEKVFTSQCWNKILFLGKDADGVLQSEPSREYGATQMLTLIDESLSEDPVGDDDLMSTTNSYSLRYDWTTRELKGFHTEVDDLVGQWLGIIEGERIPHLPLFSSSGRRLGKDDIATISFTDYEERVLKEAGLL